MHIWNEHEMKNHFGDDLGSAMRRLFMENSYSVAGNNEFYVNYSCDVPVKINQWLCTLENREALFSCFPVLNEKDGLDFLEDASFPQDGQNKWYFIDNPCKGKRSKNRLERLCSYHKPQLLYAVAQVFSKEEADKLYFVNNGHNPLPMKIWVNGRLVFSCYKESLIRRSEGIVRLKAGCNLILVEREIVPQHKIKDMFMDTNFTISLYPLSHFLGMEKGLPFLDKKLLMDMGNMVDFITPKKIFGMGEKILFYVVQHNSSSVNTFEIWVSDTNGVEIYIGCFKALQQSEMRLDKITPGVVKVIVREKESGFSNIDFLYIGDIDQIVECNDDNRVEELWNIFDFRKNVVRDSIYPIDNNVYYHVFENLYYFNERQLGEFFYLNWIETHDQGRKRSFGVLLPEGYDEGNKYPLVIQYVAGYGDYAIPGLNGAYPEYCIRNKRYRGAVVVFIACEYEYLNIYELLSIGDIYNHLMNKYSIDRQRVSIIGFCGSANSCMRLLLFYPDIFSAAIFLAPYIDNKTMEVMDKVDEDDVHIHMILNSSSGLFLPGVTYSEHCKSEITITPDLEHEELFILYNNENLIAYMAGCLKESKAIHIDHSAQLDCMGIAGMYTGKCSVLCNRMEENEKPVMRELLSLMQLSKYRNLNMQIGNMSEQGRAFVLFRTNEIPEDIVKEIRESMGITFSDKELIYEDKRYTSNFFAIVLLRDRERCYIVYDSCEALEKLRDFWGIIGTSSAFYSNVILWNKEKGFIKTGK